MTHTDLIEKLSKLDGPCRECELDIYCAINGLTYEREGKAIQTYHDGKKDFRFSYHDAGIILPVTASIDSALTLVPEGWHWEIDSGRCEIAPERWPHYENANESGGGQYEHHKVPAIAICIASLRAIEAMEGE